MATSPWLARERGAGQRVWAGQRAWWWPRVVWRERKSSAHTLCGGMYDTRSAKCHAPSKCAVKLHTRPNHVKLHHDTLWPEGKSPTSSAEDISRARLGAQSGLCKGLTPLNLAIRSFFPKLVRLITCNMQRESALRATCAAASGRCACSVIPEASRRYRRCGTAPWQNAAAD